MTSLDSIHSSVGAPELEVQGQALPATEGSPQVSWYSRVVSWLQSWTPGSAVDATATLGDELLCASGQPESSSSWSDWLGRGWTWVRTGNDVDGVARRAWSDPTQWPGMAGDGWHWLTRRGASEVEGAVEGSSGGLKRSALDWGIRLGLFNPEKEMAKQRWRMDQFSESSTRSEAAGIAAIFIRDLIQHELKYPKPENPDNPSWTQHIGLAGKDRSTFGKIISWSAQKQTEFLKETVEGLVIKGGANFSNRLHSKAVDRRAVGRYEKDFQIDLTLGMLEDSLKHFDRINDIKKEYGNSVDDAIVIEKLGSQLHPAISPSDEMLPEDLRRQQRMDRFYLPTTERVLDIMFPGGSADLPVPYGFREMVWEQLKTNVIPDLLEGLVKDVLNPRSMNKILLAGVQAANSGGEGAEIDASRYANDPKQRELEKLCGHATQTFARLLAPKMSKIVLGVPGIEDKIGVHVALKVRQALNDWPMDRVINEGVFAGLPKWLPGHWEDGEGNVVQEYRPGDDLQFKGCEPVEFQFPRNAKERHDERLGREAEDKENIEKLSKEVRKLVKNSVKDFVPGYLASKWSPVDRWLDDLFCGYLGRSRGAQVKGRIGRVVGFFLGATSSVAKFATWPAWKTAEILLDRYIRHLNQVVQREGHRKVHESLLMRATDDFLARLAR